ncbi:MAG: cell division protein FtsL [Candidatus Endobugula sp.]|jgi:cell division protein FtsL
MKSLSRIEKKKAFRQQIVWVALLWVMMLVSALTVVYSAYDTRNKFNALEVLRSEQDALQVEWGKYLLEESAWASYGRIEKVAIEKLAMEIPTGEQLILVVPNE